MPQRCHYQNKLSAYHIPHKSLNLYRRARMPSFLKTFHSDEDGAVTVDWVVITASIVIFAATLGYGLRDKTIVAGDAVSAQISAQVTP